MIAIILVLVFLAILVVWYLMILHFKKKLLAKQARKAAMEKSQKEG